MQPTAGLRATRIAGLRVLPVAVGIAALAVLVSWPKGGWSGSQSVAAVLIQWSPWILRGFLINLCISAFAIVLATVLGTFVGIGRLSEFAPVRWFCWAFVNFFRNSPWLVVLFYCMLLLPFGTGGLAGADWLKAGLGIAIPAAANMAEIVRGAMQSIPTAQWESAKSLAFTRTQTIWLIILPQCVRRMLPPWMNLYALIVVSTPLCAIVGVQEGMAAVADMLAAHERADLLMPAYLYLLLIFFAFCYPIARLTRHLERRMRTGD